MYLERLAQLESGNNPNAANPTTSARGLYQFTNATGQQYGITDPYDVQQQQEAIKQFTADNYTALKTALNREPTEGELYLAHQQGANGALKLLSNPDARAVDVVGQDAVVNNGGNADMTAGDFANQWVQKFEQPQSDLSGMSNEDLMRIAGVNAQPEDSAPDLQNISNEELMKIAGVQQPQQAQPQQQSAQERRGAISGLLEDWQNRANKQQDIIASQDNPLSKALQVVGNVGDATGDVIGAGYRGLMSLAPESAKRGERALIGLVSPTAQKAGSAIAPALSPLAKLAQEHPEATRNIEGLVGLSQLFPAAKALKETAGFAGDVAGMAGNAAKTGAVKALAPNVEKSAATLADRAKNFGIDLRLDQVAPSRVRNTVQKVSQEVPFSGVQDFEKKQIGQWNKALAQTSIGKESFAPENIKGFLKEISQKYDDILKGEKLNINADDIGKLDQIYEDADLTMTGELRNIVGKNIAKFKEDVGSGVVDGEKLASFRSSLIKRIPTVQGEVKTYLGDLVNVIDDVTDRSISAKKIQELKDVRRQWRNFRTVEPLAEKATDGLINPTALMQRVASSPYIKASRASVGEDDIVDLARIGKEFLEKKGGSDTFQKGALTLGAGYSLANPSTAALPLVGIATNRAFQKLYNESPALLNYAVKKGIKQ